MAGASSWCWRKPLALVFAPTPLRSPISPSKPHIFPMGPGPAGTCAISLCVWSYPSLCRMGVGSLQAWSWITNTQAVKYSFPGLWDSGTTPTHPHLVLYVY